MDTIKTMKETPINPSNPSSYNKTLEDGWEAVYVVLTTLRDTLVIILLTLLILSIVLLVVSTLLRRSLKIYGWRLSIQEVFLYFYLHVVYCCFHDYFYLWIVPKVMLPSHLQKDVQNIGLIGRANK